MRCCLESCSALVRKDVAASICESNPMSANECLENRQLALTALETCFNDHLKELRNFLCIFLQPLNISNIISADISFVCLVLDEYLTIGSELLDSLNINSVQSNSTSDMEGTGMIFLQRSSSLNSVLGKYSLIHPALIRALTDNQHIISDHFGHSDDSDFLITITRNLASPFRLFQKMPALLRDLEYTYEESNPDRGDLQRACNYYEYISESCEKSRKRKELEVDILSRNVIGYEGEPMASFGTPLAATNVYWQVDSGGVCTELKERILLLYPKFLLSFSYNQDKDQYKFEGKHTLSNLRLVETPNINNYTQLTDKRILELTGSFLQKFIITFPTVIEYNNWKCLLNQNVNQSSPIIMNPNWGSSRASSTNNNTSHTISTNNFPTFRTSPVQLLSSNPKKCIRPHGTRKPICDDHSATIDGTRSFRRQIKTNKKLKGNGNGTSDVIRRLENCESDAMLLGIIESYHKYATSTVSGHIKAPIESVVSSSKGSVAMYLNEHNNISERNVIVAVSHINQQMRELQAALRNLKRDLSEEKKARMKLEKDIEYDRSEQNRMKSS